MDFKVVAANGSTAPLEREARKAIEQIGGGYLKSEFVSSRWNDRGIAGQGEYSSQLDGSALMR
jgi:hypothetical protein